MTALTGVLPSTLLTIVPLLTDLYALMIIESDGYAVREIDAMGTCPMRPVIRHFTDLVSRDIVDMHLNVLKDEWSDDENGLYLTLCAEGGLSNWKFTRSCDGNISYHIYNRVRRPGGYRGTVLVAASYSGRVIPFGGSVLKGDIAARMLRRLSGLVPAKYFSQACNAAMHRCRGFAGLACNPVCLDGNTFEDASEANGICRYDPQTLTFGNTEEDIHTPVEVPRPYSGDWDAINACDPYNHNLRFEGISCRHIFDNTAVIPISDNLRNAIGEYYVFMNHRPVVTVAEVELVARITITPIRENNAEVIPGLVVNYDRLNARDFREHFEDQLVGIGVILPDAPELDLLREELMHCWYRFSQCLAMPASRIFDHSVFPDEYMPSDCDGNLIINPVRDEFRPDTLRDWFTGMTVPIWSDVVDPTINNFLIEPDVGWSVAADSAAAAFQSSFIHFVCERGMSPASLENSRKFYVPMISRPAGLECISGEHSLSTRSVRTANFVGYCMPGFHGSHDNRSFFRGLDPGTSYHVVQDDNYFYSDDINSSAALEAAVRKAFMITDPVEDGDQDEPLFVAINRRLSGHMAFIRCESNGACSDSVYCPSGLAEVWMNRNGVKVKPKFEYTRRHLRVMMSGSLGALDIGIFASSSL